MNVLLVDHAPFFGGAESFLLDLLTALDRENFTPIIVTDPHSPVLERFRASGDAVFTTPLPQINRPPFFLWRLIRAGAQLARVACESHADLMHTFTARTHLIGVVASKFSGIPLLWRICDDTLPAPILSAFARVPRCIVAVSRWITTCYPNLRFDGLVPDGVGPPGDISRANVRAELGFKPDELVVAHVGRLVRWKGQAVFLRALAQAVPAVPNLRGLIVGTWQRGDERPGPLGGGESYYRELRALAIELSLNTPSFERLIFGGFFREPSRAYAAADIVAHTSTLPEPFGRTVIEAMMAGRPVIAAHAGALPEIVSHGETGILTPPEDVGALADAIIALSKSEEQRAKMGHAGHERAEAEFSLAAMARRMESFYRKTAHDPKFRLKSKI